MSLTKKIRKNMSRVHNKQLCFIRWCTTGAPCAECKRPNEMKLNGLRYNRDEVIARASRVLPATEVQRIFGQV